VLVEESREDKRAHEEPMTVSLHASDDTYWFEKQKESTYLVDVLEKTCTIADPRLLRSYICNTIVGVRTKAGSVATRNQATGSRRPGDSSIDCRRAVVLDSDDVRSLHDELWERRLEVLALDATGRTRERDGTDDAI